MEIINDKGLLVRTRHPEKVTTAIKQSKYLKDLGNGIHNVLVNWTLDNSRRLANLGMYQTPAPIERDYDWPGIHKPYDHQIKTASFLVANNRAFCFNEQGTGKTKSVIWAADYLMKLGDVKRVLVICPMSIMNSAWMDDIFKTAMHRTAAVAHGSRQKRIDVIKKGYDFTIINYDGVDIVKEELKGKFDLIVCDEANYVKTVTTRRWKAIDHILDGSTKIWMLTGTPAAQSPLDAFGLAKMAVPQRIPKYYGSWRDKVMVRQSQFKWKPSLNATELVNAALQPAIRFTKEQCLDLPPVTYQTREVPLSAQQTKY
jgi:SNF2 family DNA or RNA helicase